WAYLLPPLTLAASFQRGGLFHERPFQGRIDHMTPRPVQPAEMLLKSLMMRRLGPAFSGAVMSKKYNVLILGASYGSLLATKLAMAGHDVRLVCLPAEAEIINAEGTRVRFPVRGREGLIEVDSRNLPGKISAATPADVNPADYDLVGLAMQEPQYRAPGVRELLAAVAKAKVPAMSIMNMPPLPYLRRLPRLASTDLAH